MVTDFDGRIFIEVPREHRFAGFVCRLRRRSCHGDGRYEDLEIKLTPRQEELEDVVVTGMAPRKVESFSGSYVSVKGRS